MRKIAVTIVTKRSYGTPRALQSQAYVFTLEDLIELTGEAIEGEYLLS